MIEFIVNHAEFIEGFMFGISIMAFSAFISINKINKSFGPKF